MAEQIEHVEKSALATLGVPILLGCIATGVLSAVLFSPTGKRLPTVESLAKEAQNEYNALAGSVAKAMNAAIAQGNSGGRKLEENPRLVLRVEHVEGAAPEGHANFNVYLSATTEHILYENKGIESIVRTGNHPSPFLATVRINITQSAKTVEAGPVAVTRPLEEKTVAHWLKEWNEPKSAHRLLSPLPRQDFLPKSFEHEIYTLKLLVLKDFNSRQPTTTTQEISFSLKYNAASSSWVRADQPAHDDHGHGSHGAH